MSNQNPEQIARDKIDSQLIDCGWIIQDKKKFNLAAGLGVAIREYQTDIGPADYILFVDRKAVGIIEAKREEEGVRLTTVEEQSSQYANAKLRLLNNDPLPFVYESTGAITRFTDYRDPKPTTKFWNVDTAFGLCVNDKYDSKLLFYFCLGFNFKKLDKSTTIPSLAKSDILSIDIQVPPLKEQQQIVREIESRLSVADKMEESINESLKQAEALRQSILKKAFSGELI